MTNEEQIIWINSIVKTKLMPSKVHGIGVFALRDIGKGEKLYGNLFPKIYNLPYSYFGKLFPEIKELLLERFPNIVNGSGFGYPDHCIQGMMNHSEENNYDGITDVVLKDIKKGEEIFENYKQIPNYEKVFKWLK